LRMSRDQRLKVQPTALIALGHAGSVHERAKLFRIAACLRVCLIQLLPHAREADALVSAIAALERGGCLPARFEEVPTPQPQSEPRSPRPPPRGE
jgi:hypothetical protein